MTITGPCSEKNLITVQSEQFLLLLSERCWACACVAFEEGAKMGLVLEAELVGYFLNRHGCCAE